VLCVYRDACPCIALRFSGVDLHCPFALSDRFDCVGYAKQWAFILVYCGFQPSYHNILTCFQINSTARMKNSILMTNASRETPSVQPAASAHNRSGTG
jgi:hypothetical protein